MRYVLVFILTSFLIGCATTSSTQTYRPRGDEGNGWAINGTMNELGKHTVLINGQKVIEGNVSAWDGSGTLFGQYQDLSVRSECSSVAYGKTYPDCRVYVDNELAATLTF